MSNERTIATPASSDLATFTIRINGEAIDRTFQIMSVYISKEINRIPSAKIVMLDGDPSSEKFPAFDGNLFIPGNEIEILAGYHSDEDTLFKGVIVKNKVSIRKEGSATLNIECRDKAFKMSVGKNNRYFADLKDSDAILEILDNYDVETDIESTRVTHEELVQYDITDWDFILTRIDLNGKLCIVDDGKISAVSPDLSKEPLVNLKYGATLLEFDAEIDARLQYAGVTTAAWDAANQEIMESEGSEPGFPEAGNLTAGDLSEALALDVFSMHHGGQLNDDLLQLWADAKLMKSRLAKIRGRAKFQGKADVKPGTMIELAGVGERINGNHLVSGVFHSIAQGNWETDVQIGLNPEWFTDMYNLRQNGASAISHPINGLHIGVVTKLEGDPKGEDRIQVKIPAVNAEEEGVWTRLSCTDAGDNRGMFFRPEIGDEVVIGHLDNDPSNPVVLGMLHSSAKPSPVTISDDNHEKGIITRSEIKFIFNDEKKKVTVETPAGKSFVIDDDQGIMSMEDENGNKILLNSSGITLESAKDLILKASGDIKSEGVNVNNKAQASFKAEGSAGSEITSSATVKIKGSLVQIN